MSAVGLHATPAVNGLIATASRPANVQLNQRDIDLLPDIVVFRKVCSFCNIQAGLSWIPDALYGVLFSIRNQRSPRPMVAGSCGCENPSANSYLTR